MEREDGVWWHDPALLALVVVVPTGAAAYFVSAERYQLAWRLPKYMDLATLGLLGFALAAFLAGSVVGSGAVTKRTTPWPQLSSAARHALISIFGWLFGLTIFGYVTWLANAVRNGLRPGDVITALTSQDTVTNDLSVVFVNIPGVTTLTQLGIAVAVVGALLHVSSSPGGEERPSWHRWAMGVVIFLAVARAFLLTERLAVIEVVVPILLIRTAAWRPTGVRRRLLQLGPLLALPALVLGFGIFEYSRSWTFFAERRDGTFAEFAVERLIGYYSTSYNNATLFLDDGLGDTLPSFTLQFFRELPPVMAYTTSLEDQTKDAAFLDLIERKANPEFNSPGGILGAFADYPLPGAALFLFLSGLMIGCAYRDFLRGGLWGLCLYPVFFSGILDLPRVITWTLGRVFPAIVGCVVVAIITSRHARRELTTMDEAAPLAQVARAGA